MILHSLRKYVLIFKNRPLGLSAIVLMTTLAFSNIFQNSFLLDDYAFIVDWPLIQDLKNVPRFFVNFIPPGGQADVYSPLKTFFHALNFHFWGINLDGHHFTSILIHLLGTFFVYRLTLLLVQNRPIAFLTGLLFGLHPVHVEAITFMSASVDTFGIVLLFISFYCYVKARGNNNTFVVKEGDQEGNPFIVNPNRKDYYFSILFAFLAVFTNEIAVSIPLLFLFYDVWFSGKKESKAKIAARIWPFFAIVVLYSLAEWIVLGALTDGKYLSGSFSLTMLLMIKVWAKYILVVLFPYVLSYNQLIAPGISSFWQNDFNAFAVLSQSIFEFQTMLSLTLLIAVAVLAVRSFKKDPIILFCVGWFFISLLPASNIIPSSVYFAEKYLYAGSFAFCLLLSYLLIRAYGKLKENGKQIVIGVTVMIVAFYAFRTYIRNQDWRDELSLYESAVRTNPQNGYLYNELGVAYTHSGQFSKAVDSFRQAIALNPKEPHFYFSTEGVYVALEQMPQAVQALQRAVELNPEFAEGYFNLAGIHAFLGKTIEAERYLQKAVELFRKQGRIIEASEALLSFQDYMENQQSLEFQP